LLTDRYVQGIPEDSRAAKPHGFLKREQITEEKLGKVYRLKQIAQARRQSLAQMAIAWVLRHPGMTSALIGASRVNQIEEIVGALNSLSFSGEELQSIEQALQN
jgi:L-glyceraldehyde 3-phosphate reductase